MTKKKKKSKKTPTRMCVGCREKKPKEKLIRIVKTPQGEIKLDESGKMNGRGVYLCKDENCFNLAFKKNRLQKSLRAQIKEEEKEGIKMTCLEMLTEK